MINIAWRQVLWQGSLADCSNTVLHILHQSIKPITQIYKMLITVQKNRRKLILWHEYSNDR